MEGTTSKQGEQTNLDQLGTLLCSYPPYDSVPAQQMGHIHKIDKIRRAFLLRGATIATGGHCIVNWKRVLRPKRLGGLGIADLSNFNKALHLRW
jgi:hypothetical protein